MKKAALISFSLFALLPLTTRVFSLVSYPPFFSIDPNSPSLAGPDGSLGTSDDLSAADILGVDYSGPSLSVEVPSVSLNLPANGSVDALSLGIDYVLPDWITQVPNPSGIGFLSNIYFWSVDRESKGGVTGGPNLSPPPVIRARSFGNPTQAQAEAGEAAGDIFVQLFDSIAPQFRVNILFRDEESIALQGASTPIDDLDALAWVAGRKDIDGGDGVPDTPVYFSVDKATAAALGVSPADILFVNGSGPLQVYANHTDLGLNATDDIDALSIWDAYTKGVFDTYDGIHLSLNRNSTSLAGNDTTWDTPDDYSPADVFYVTFNFTFPGKAIPPGGPMFKASFFSLKKTDNLNALWCTFDDPGEFVPPRERDWPMFRHDPGHTGYSFSSAPDTNQTLWTYTTGGPIFSSPAVANGMVFIGNIDDWKLYALNETTGKSIWNFTAAGAITSSPAIKDNMVFITSQGGKIYALNATTGALIWNYTTPEVGFEPSSPTIADGMVFTSTNKVYALNETTGQLIWKSWTISYQLPTSPAVADGMVFVGAIGTNKGVYALNETTGASIWNYTTVGGVSSSPAVADGMVLVGGAWDNWRVHALNETTGQSLWNYTTTGGVISSPAIAFGKVYIGSTDTKIYTLNQSTGALIWSYTTGDAIISSPAVAGGIVFIGSVDNKVYALNQSTGDLIWSYTTGDDVRSSPAVANGMVFVGSYDRKVYAFRSLHDVTVIDKTTLSTVHGPPGTPYTPVTEAYPTWTVEINVTVQNQGDFTEEFTVQAFYGNSTGNYTTGISPTSYVVTLGPGASTSKVFTWDVPEIPFAHPYPTYTIYANVSVVPGETDIADNIRDAVVVTVKWRGDSNGDGKVGLPDLMCMAMAYVPGTPGAPNYNPQCDFSGDGSIGLPDLMILAMNYDKGPLD